MVWEVGTVSVDEAGDPAVTLARRPLSATAFDTKDATYIHIMCYDQVGVIPFRRGCGGIEVLLITSRTRGRWICPKGNIEEEHGPRGSARLEAFEEAGVSGRLVPPALGIYEHGDPPRTKIRVWLLEVEEEHETWPEDDERKRKWLPLQEARVAVDEEGLARLIGQAATQLTPDVSTSDACAE